MLPELPRLLAQGNRALELATGGTRLLGAVRRAAAGDGDALDYLRQDGVHDAADLLVPGAGSLSRTFREQLGALRSGRLVEGEYRVLDGQAAYPWQPCLRWIIGQDWGTFVILGPKGRGKTTLAFRLAQRWHEATGFPVDCVNVYQGDVPDWATRRPSWWFTGLTKRLVETLDPPAPPAKPKTPKAPPGRIRLVDLEDDENDDADAFEDAEELPSLDDEAFVRRYSGRILIIDEMSAFCGMNPGDPKRVLVRRIMQQARHLRWLIVFVGQIARHVPEDLLSCEAIFVKEPLGDEETADRDNPLVVKFWRDAGEAFDALKTSPWRGIQDGLYADLWSWAYVHCRPCPGGGYSGLLPFSPAGP